MRCFQRPFFGDHFVKLSSIKRQNDKFLYFFNIPFNLIFAINEISSVKIVLICTEIASRGAFYLVTIERGVFLFLYNFILWKSHQSHIFYYLHLRSY